MMRRLRLLQLDALLLAVRVRIVIVTLVLIAIVRALLLRRRVRRCGLSVLVVVVGLRVLVVILSSSRHPAGAVVRLATGFAAATGRYARAYDEEEEESDDDEHGDEPADPIVPGAPVAVSHPISVPTSGHCLSLQVVEVEKRSRLKLFDDAMGR